MFIDAIGEMINNIHDNVKTEQDLEKLLDAAKGLALDRICSSCSPFANIDDIFAQASRQQAAGSDGRGGDGR